MIIVSVIGTGYEFQVPEHLAAEFARMYPCNAADIASEFPDQAAAVAEALSDRNYIPFVVEAVPSATAEILKRCPDACRHDIFLALLGSELITDGGDIIAALDGVTIYDHETEDIMAATPEEYGADIASELFRRNPACWPTWIGHLSMDNAKEFVGRHRQELDCDALTLEEDNAVIYALVYPDKADEAAKRFPELVEDILDVTPPTSAHLIVMAVPCSIESVVTQSDKHLLDVVSTLFDSRDDARATEVLEALCQRGLSEDEIATTVTSTPDDKILAIADWLFNILPDSWPVLVSHLSPGNAREFVSRHRIRPDCAALTLEEDNAVIYALVYPDKADEAAKRFPELVEDIISIALSDHLRVVADRIFDAIPDSWPVLIAHLPPPTSSDFLRAHSADIAKRATLITPPRFHPESH